MTPSNNENLPRQKPTALFLQNLKKYFWSGLLVILPIAITILGIQWLVRTIDNILSHLLPQSLSPENLFGFHIPGMGLLLGLLLILLIGVFSANYLGQWLLLRIETLTRKIPLIGAIYSLFKQLANTTFGEGCKSFNRVVLIEYPRKQIWSIGFVTGVSTGEVQKRTSEKVINIFVPTTPNPTSGFYIMVPEKDTIPLSMSVDDAFKLIISGGIYSPPDQ